MEAVMDEVIALVGEREAIDLQMKPLKQRRKALQDEIVSKLSDIAEALDVPQKKYKGFTFGREQKKKTSYSKKNVQTFLNENQHTEFVEQFTEDVMKPLFKRQKVE